MIKYNTAKIEGNLLVIDFEVENKSYYSGTKIIGVRIDTISTYGTDYPYTKLDKKPVTQYSEKIPVTNDTRELFIITPLVKVSFSDPDSLPCGADVVDKAIVYDKSVLINMGLNYLKELGDTCETPKGFVDFILRRYALDMAISTCNYGYVIKYWKMLTAMKGTTIKSCGCHGG